MVFLRQYLLGIQYKKVVKVSGCERKRKTAHLVELCRRRMEPHITGGGTSANSRCRGLL